LGNWLGAAVADTWEPRCELRVHATLEELHEATETGGATRALTETRVQGERMLARRINLCQSDPWLLSSTLPHELTHVLLADAYRDGKLPLAIDEGLAVQSEPPARRLQLRRLLGRSAPNLADLLTAAAPPADESAFSAGCDTLAGLLLRRAALSDPNSAAHSPLGLVLETFRNGYTRAWWKTLGWESEAALLEDWRAWHAARRDPPRMPLMILARPSRPVPQNQP
jgi:hypothetical protein